jgi:hypothetical protein
MDRSYQGSYSRAGAATVTRDVGWQHAAPCPEPSSAVLS